MGRWKPLFVLFGSLLLIAPALSADGFDPYLHQKALDYDALIRQWHTTGMGGSTDIYFTDETRTEIYRTAGAGDSTDWTTFYLVSQCLRYRITGEELALSEVDRIARYLHVVHAITDSPGYLARYAGLDVPPWNVESVGTDSYYQATGEYAGMFWLGHQSRDKFMHWFWGMSWAYDTVTDEALKQTIREDMERVAGTLEDQNWTIIDPWGDIWAAADIGADIRMEIMLAVAHVTGDPYWWDALDREFTKMIAFLPLTMFHGFNRYFDYYAFINDVPVSNHLFRLWPDRARLLRFFDAWYRAVRRYQENTHAALFDVIYYGACLRLGICNDDEIDPLRADVIHGLTVFWDPPNYQRYVECSELPLDPLSVWADEVARNNPWIDDLINIEVQTIEPHEVEDRCWSSHLWEVKPYHVECTRPEDKTRTAPGLDYTLAYWFGVYFGLLPGDGPYDDFAFYSPEVDEPVDEGYDADDDAPAPKDEDGDDDTATPDDAGDDDGGCA